MTKAADVLRRTAGIGAHQLKHVVGRAILQLCFSPARFALFWKFKFALPCDHAGNLRDDLAGLANCDRRTDRNFVALNETGVVQCRA